MIYKNKWYWIVLLLTSLFILVIFPFFTSYLMITNIGIKVETDNDWIGFFASYFGAIIGGITRVD